VPSLVVSVAMAWSPLGLSIAASPCDRIGDRSVVRAVIRRPKNEFPERIGFNRAGGKCKGDNGNRKRSGAPARSGMPRASGAGKAACDAALSGRRAIPSGREGKGPGPMIRYARRDRARSGPGNGSRTPNGIRGCCPRLRPGESAGPALDIGRPTGAPPGRAFRRA